MMWDMRPDRDGAPPRERRPSHGDGRGRSNERVATREHFPAPSPQYLGTPAPQMSSVPFPQPALSGGIAASPGRRISYSPAVVTPQVMTRSVTPGPHKLRRGSASPQYQYAATPAGVLQQRPRAFSTSTPAPAHHHHSETHHHHHHTHSRTRSHSHSRDAGAGGRSRSQSLSQPAPAPAARQHHHARAQPQLVYLQPGQQVVQAGGGVQYVQGGQQVQYVPGQQVQYAQPGQQVQYPRAGQQVQYVQQGHQEAPPGQQVRYVQQGQQGGQQGQYAQQQGQQQQQSRGGAQEPQRMSVHHYCLPTQHPLFQYSRCTGRKKAVCIGINYRGQPHELKGCINDAKDVRNFLIQRYGYKSGDIVLLVDDSPHSRQQPTRRNMLDAMRWLVADAKKHDSLFFHYSGHGGQTPDLDGDETDGLDEVIFPSDFKTQGHIVDDLLHEIMVKPLPPGCRLTSVFDSCHSGTVLDLPFIYHSDGRLNRSVRVTDVALRTRMSPADAISFSGCRDDQTSADTFTGREAVGAMSSAFIAVLQQNQHMSYRDLIRAIREHLKRKYSQKPVLSSSHEIDTTFQFIM